LYRFAGSGKRAGEARVPTVVLPEIKNSAVEGEVFLLLAKPKFLLHYSLAIVVTLAAKRAGGQGRNATF
jgi:hypothetical protein